MGLRERAIEAYMKDKREHEEKERRAAQRFAERKARDFESIFGAKPDKVQPVTPYECSIECDGLTFKVRDTAFGTRYEVGVPCPKCGKPVFRGVDSLINLGYVLSTPAKCSECICSIDSPEPREPSVEEQIVQKLREILDLLQEG